MYDHFIHAAILNQATPSLMLVIDHSLWLAVMFVCEQLFTGEIPEEWTQLPPVMDVLRVSSNQLTGTVCVPVSRG